MLLGLENVYLFFSNFYFSPVYEDSEEAFNARRLKNSVKLYTSFDWSKVPRIEERRQTDSPFDSPEIITHVYR